jgi:FtsZ-interacting cell division protein ZipA
MTLPQQGERRLVSISPHGGVLVKRTKEEEMSALAIIAIVVGALIVLAIVVAALRSARERREFGQVQTEARRDDAVHHREQAQEQRTEAAIAQERAKRAEVEAQLNEERAERREQEV